MNLLQIQTQITVNYLSLFFVDKLTQVNSEAGNNDADNQNKKKNKDNKDQDYRKVFFAEVEFLEMNSKKKIQNKVRT